MTGLLLGELDSDFDQMSDLYSSFRDHSSFALSGMQVGFHSLINFAGFYCVWV